MRNFVILEEGCHARRPTDMSSPIRIQFINCWQITGTTQQADASYVHGLEVLCNREDSMHASSPDLPTECPALATGPNCVHAERCLSDDTLHVVYQVSSPKVYMPPSSNAPTHTRACRCMHERVRRRLYASIEKEDAERMIHLKHTCGNLAQEVSVVGGCDEGALEVFAGLLQHLLAGDVQVVSWLIQHQEGALCHHELGER